MTTMNTLEVGPDRESGHDAARPYLVRREFLPLASLADWGINPRGGELRGVEEFAERLGVEGIREDLHVFPLNGVMTIMQGHRRKAAGLRAGIEAAWCKVYDFADEREAFMHLLSLQNGSDPFDSRELARAAQEGLKMGIAREDLVHVFHRSEETVQLYLDLGTLPVRAQEAVWQSRMALGTAGMLRRVEKGQQEKAVQGILGGVIAGEPMSEAQARNYIEEQFLKPARWAKEWEALEMKLKRGKCKVVDGFQYVAFADRGEYCSRDSGMTLPGYVPADECIQDEELVNPREPMRWGELARRHEAPVWVVAAPHHANKYATVVHVKMLREAEEMMGEGRVLKGKEKKGKVGGASAQSSVLSAQGEEGREVLEIPDHDHMARHMGMQHCEGREGCGNCGMRPGMSRFWNQGPPGSECVCENCLAELYADFTGESGSEEAGRSAHAPLGEVYPLGGESDAAQRVPTSEVDGEEVWGIVAQVVGVLANEPTWAMRDKCYTPLVARMFRLLEVAGVPSLVLQRLQTAYHEAAGPRLGLRFVLTMLITAELCDAEDAEVTTEVLGALGVKAGDE